MDVVLANPKKTKAIAEAKLKNDGTIEKVSDFLILTCSNYSTFKYPKTRFIVKPHFGVVAMKTEKLDLSERIERRLEIIHAHRKRGKTVRSKRTEPLTAVEIKAIKEANQQYPELGTWNLSLLLSNEFSVHVSTMSILRVLNPERYKSPKIAEKVKF